MPVSLKVLADPVLTDPVLAATGLAIIVPVLALVLLGLALYLRRRSASPLDDDGDDGTP